MRYLQTTSRRRRCLLIHWYTPAEKAHCQGLVRMKSRFASYPDNLMEIIAQPPLPFLLEHYDNHVIGTVTRIFFERCLIRRCLVGKAQVVLHLDPLSDLVYQRDIRSHSSLGISPGYRFEWADTRTVLRGGELIQTIRRIALTELSLTYSPANRQACIERMWEELIPAGECIPGSEMRIPLLGPPEGVPHGCAEGAACSQRQTEKLDFVSFSHPHNDVQSNTCDFTKTKWGAS